MAFDGRFWLVYLLAVTKISDVGAYFGGKFFGRHKLAAKISPNKTIEGAVIGLICSIAMSYLFYLFYNNNISSSSLNLNMMIFIFLGLMLGVLALLGDLIESLFKRDADIKDSSSLPGVGGFLDMIDSLILNIPFLFFFLEALI